MAASDFTKQHIAQAMKELLQSRSFASVSVSDLTRQCGVGRNTFYYHFHDKYEVVSWIFFEEIAPLLSRFDRLENWTGGLSELCLYLQKNRDFYIRVLEFEGQNSFCQCLTEFYRKLVYDLLRQNGGQSVTERQLGATPGKRGIPTTYKHLPSGRKRHLPAECALFRADFPVHALPFPRKVWYNSLVTRFFPRSLR